MRKKGIGVGTFTDTVEGINFWSKKKLRFLQYASDLNLLIQAARSLMEEVKDVSLQYTHQISGNKKT